MFCFFFLAKNKNKSEFVVFFFFSELLSSIQANGYNKAHFLIHDGYPLWGLCSSELQSPLHQKGCQFRPYHGPHGRAHGRNLSQAQEQKRKREQF